MICNKCGRENENNVNFCVFCGSDLTQNQTVQVEQANVAPVIAPVENTEATQTANTSNQKKFDTTFIKDNFNKLKSYLLKPLESVNNDSEDIKSVGIFGGILVVLMTLVNLIMAMVGSLKTATMDWTGKISYEFDFSNLGDLDYVGLIFKNLLIYAVVMLAIAGIFFIGSLIVKKDMKFPKLLTIVFIATIPFFIGNVVISTILGLIYNPLAVIASIISTIYSLVIFSHLINNEIKLDGMTKIYYNTACYSTIIIILYFIVVNIIMSAISSIGSIFSIF